MRKVLVSCLGALLIAHAALAVDSGAELQLRGGEGQPTPSQGATIGYITGTGSPAHDFWAGIFSGAVTQCLTWQRAWPPQWSTGTEGAINVAINYYTAGLTGGPGVNWEVHFTCANSGATYDGLAFPASLPGGDAITDTANGSTKLSRATSSTASIHSTANCTASGPPWSQLVIKLCRRGDTDSNTDLAYVEDVEIVK